MGKSVKLLSLGAVLAASTLGSAPAAAEFSGNIGVVSNYIWRGVTQTGDDAAIQGGLDFAHDSGFYAGTWASSLGGGSSQYELDLYLGYGGEAGAFSYDLGLIRYMYPVGDVDSDFTELYGSVGFGPVTALVAYTVDKEGNPPNENDIYYSLGAEFPLRDDLTVGVTAGRYNFDDPAAEDYTHYGASLTKSTESFGDFTFALEKNNIKDGSDIDDARVWVGWTMAFDL